MVRNRSQRTNGTVLDHTAQEDDLGVGPTQQDLVKSPPPLAPPLAPTPLLLAWVWKGAPHLRRWIHHLRRQS